MILARKVTVICQRVRRIEPGINISQRHTVISNRAPSATRVFAVGIAAEESRAVKHRVRAKRNLVQLGTRQHVGQVIVTTCNALMNGIFTGFVHVPRVNDKLGQVVGIVEQVLEAGAIRYIEPIAIERFQVLVALVVFVGKPALHARGSQAVLEHDMLHGILTNGCDPGKVISVDGDFLVGGIGVHAHHQCAGCIGLVAHRSFHFVELPVGIFVVDMLGIDEDVLGVPSVRDVTQSIVTVRI